MRPSATQVAAWLKARLMPTIYAHVNLLVRRCYSPFEIAAIVVTIRQQWNPWLLGLMYTARARQWDWFLAILLLGPLTALIYCRFGREAQAPV